MQEICPNTYIETGYAGVTLGAINLRHGLLLIDAPFLPDDVRSWRSSLINLGGGVDRMLINLDAHIDRIMGSRAMECTVVGHDELARLFQTRPFLYRSQSLETGAEWELYESFGSIRWAPPEVTFTSEFLIHWGTPIILNYCPGSGIGALWVHLPEEKVIFLGDLVALNQPPFLANADIPLWIETLDKLLTSQYMDHILIGGRNGLIRREHINWQKRFLEKVQNRLEKLNEKEALEAETESLVPGLLAEIDYPRSHSELYERRLRWGLSSYYRKQFYPENTENIEE